jgi:hypothetical protein
VRVGAVQFESLGTGAEDVGASLRDTRCQVNKMTDDWLLVSGYWWVVTGERLLVSGYW